MTNDERIASAAENICTHLIVMNGLLKRLVQAVEASQRKVASDYYS